MSKIYEKLQETYLVCSNCNLLIEIKYTGDNKLSFKCICQDEDLEIMEILNHNNITPVHTFCDNTNIKEFFNFSKRPYCWRCTIKVDYDELAYKYDKCKLNKEIQYRKCISTGKDKIMSLINKQYENTLEDFTRIKINEKISTINIDENESKDDKHPAKYPKYNTILSKQKTKKPDFNPYNLTINSKIIDKTKIQFYLDKYGFNYDLDQFDISLFQKIHRKFIVIDSNTIVYISKYYKDLKKKIYSLHLGYDTCKNKSENMIKDSIEKLRTYYDILNNEFTRILCRECVKSFLRSKIRFYYKETDEKEPSIDSVEIY